jgi:hypothetical protein
VFDAVAGSMSLRSIAWKGGQVTGPVTVGAVWDATDVTTAFLTAAAFIAVATGVFVLLYRGVAVPDLDVATGD